MKITKNVFSEDLLKSLKEFTRDGKQPSTTNFFGWEPVVVGVSNAIFCFNLNDNLQDQVTKELLEHKILKSVPKKMLAKIHLSSRGSFIPWHNDLPYKFTCTVYLNEYWDKDWGGYFMYENEEIKAIKPEHNVAISFEPPLMHTVGLTSINAPLREILQIFVVEY